MMTSHTNNGLKANILDTTFVSDTQQTNPLRLPSAELSGDVKNSEDNLREKHSEAIIPQINAVKREDRAKVFIITDIITRSWINGPISNTKVYAKTNKLWESHAIIVQFVVVVQRCRSDRPKLTANCIRSSPMRWTGRQTYF